MTTPEAQIPTSHAAGSAQRSGSAKRQWRDPSERGTEAVRGDEFDADVARALAALRQQHGHSNVSCQPAGNSSDELALLREELSAVLPGVNRRGFMQLTGAAAVFALAGCYKKHPDTIVSYAQQPEGTVLGKAVFYSSTLRDSGRPVSVMVKTYDGRPIKIEGNPDHPVTRGACDARTQASLLNLYDPDRFQNGPQKRSGKEFSATTWKELDDAVGAALKGGGKVGLITGPLDGLADRALLGEYRQLLGERLLHGIHDPLADAAGPAIYHVDRAAVLVTIGSDFLGGGATGLAEMVEFGDFRRLRGNGAQTDLGQVIAFEATMSQIGASADVRVRVSPDRFAHVGWGIAEAVGKALGVALPAGVAESLAKIAGGKPLATALDLRPVAGVDAIEFAAQQLIATKKAGRNSLIYVGGYAADAGAADAADFLNAALGNAGVTVEAVSAPAQASGSDVLLAAARGELSTLIVVEANPAYSLVAAKELIEGIEKVKTVVVLADRLHETARLAHYVAPTLHGLESWGDAESRSGVHSLQQPCIQPLWDTRGWQESLMAFVVAAGVKQASFKQPMVPCDAKQPPLTVASAKPLWVAAANGVQSWQGYVKTVWLTQIKAKAGIIADDRAFWNGALARGVVSVPQAKAAVPAYVAPKNASALSALKPAGTLSLVISASRVMGDGTWLNNAWLQELPDPVSKITWDNYVALSAKDAAERGIKPNDVIKLSVGKLAVTLPVHIQEGQHPGVIETFLGWGRAKDCAGQVANFCIEHGKSINAAVLLGDAAAPVAIEKTGETYQLANMQGHNRMEGREIAIDDVLELHRADPGRAKRGHEHALWANGTDGKVHGRLSLFGKEHDYVGHKWGMTVDLGSCTGCNACVVACNAENNVPVVGRDEVRKGREMHWIRIDRYYSSPGDDADMLDVEVIQQPVMCQQCGNAPCEEACPAMATMHNDEGVNVMVYNRCIGTRYCSNNCPYKVRRFNWYEYGKYRFGPQASLEPLGRIVRNVISDGATSSQAELNQHPLQMLLNPEVTVRSRGVMEKCNFCIQRTRDIREQEKATNQRLPDGKVTTACAQTCPTKAIVFGDRNDPESAVNRVMATAHAYQLLDSELNTRPAVSYLAKVRNRPATADEKHGLVAESAAAAHAPKATEGAH